MYCDFWYCERLRDMHHPESRQWRVRNLASSKEEEKRAFLRGIKHGYAITGGVVHVTPVPYDQMIGGRERDHNM